MKAHSDWWAINGKRFLLAPVRGSQRGMLSGPDQREGQRVRDCRVDWSRRMRSLVKRYCQLRRQHLKLVRWRVMGDAG